MLSEILRTHDRSPGDHWRGIASRKYHWCYATVWCSAIQVKWIRLKNKLTTGAAWCLVSNTEFLRKGVLFKKQMRGCVNRDKSLLSCVLFFC